MSTDEDKTRVLQRRGAKEAAPESQGEEIVFRCPNGHRIVVPKASIGRQGPCPKCNAGVTVPDGPWEELVLYCPNGHRQFAPAAKAGSRAQCSECKATVTIPGARETAKAEPAKAPPPAPPLPPPAPSAPDLQFQPPPEPVVEAAVSAEPADGGGEAEAGESWDFIGKRPEPPPAETFEPAAWTAAEGAEGFATEGGNPTAILVGRLWAERQHGAVIELHLSGGSVILPEWYDANWSRGTHGLFASQAADGSVTLTAVAWETVQKIVVRQLTEVPNDMFT